MISEKEICSPEFCPICSNELNTKSSITYFCSDFPEDHKYIINNIGCSLKKHDMTIIYYFKLNHTVFSNSTENYFIINGKIKIIDRSIDKTFSHYQKLCHFQ